MPTTNYFIRASSKKKNDLATIYIRFKSGRDIDQTSKTPIFIKPEYWSESNQTVKLKAGIPNKEEIHQKLVSLRRHIEDSYLSISRHDIDKDWLKITIERHFNPEKFEETKETLFSFIANFIEESHTRINPDSGKNIAKNTIKLYNTCFNHLKGFQKYRKTTFDFEDVTYDLYLEFTTYLSKTMNLATNSIGKQVAVFKTFLTEAYERRLITNTDFKSRKFKVVSEETESIALSEQELQDIYNLDLSSNKRLEKVKDLFLVGCWTGCRFSDVIKITPNKIKNGMIILEQQKTGTKVYIPIHPIVQNILDKYEGILPDPISNQKFNEYIKEVCKLAEITSIERHSITKGGKRIEESFEKWEMVSSHTARRSFATNLYRSGFPTISIMKITGHKTERSFLKYIKVSEEEHACMLQNHWEKAFKEQQQAFV